MEPGTGIHERMTCQGGLRSRWVSPIVQEYRGYGRGLVHRLWGEPAAEPGT